jgi:putative peptidoglycan lipid II flippase
LNLLKAASTVSLLTLASRITGLVREQLIAATFGASAATDAFNVAFRIPNLFRRLFAEGAFSQAFVPLLPPRGRNTAMRPRAASSTPWPPCWPGCCC